MSEVSMTMAQAVKLAGVSEASIRNITSGRFAKYYVDFLSSGARPGTGQPRSFTPGDVTLLRYIASRTKQGATHGQVAEEVRNGALADFEPPEVTARQAEEARPARQAEQSLALTTVQEAALTMGQEIARELGRVMSTQLEQAKADNDALQDRLREAEGRAAAAEREAMLLRAELARARRGLLRRLFGG